MNGKKRRLPDKTGSYLVEATLTLPVMILGTIALALIINIIAVCETIGFVTSCELKNSSIVDSNIVNTVSLCKKIEAAVADQCPDVSGFRIQSVVSGQERGGIYDLIRITTETDFSVSNPLGIHGQVIFRENLMARSFTGALQNAGPLEEEAFNQRGDAANVWIYPRYGERFHQAACNIVQMQTQEGNPGWEMDRQEARRRGFTPCRICGGGVS